MDILTHLKKGAFLTTIHENKVNTMTIAWGLLGVEWGEDIFVTLVRDSRFSKIALDKTGKFTVTIPLDDSMKQELSYCGHNSGRDMDKIKECNLKLIPSKSVDVPVINCKSIVLECEVIYSQRMEETNMNNDFKNKFYQTGDIHTLYHSRILDIYEV